MMSNILKIKHTHLDLGRNTNAFAKTNIVCHVSDTMCSKELGPTWVRPMGSKSVPLKAINLTHLLCFVLYQMITKERTE